jgi:hypothetical protein
MSWTTEGGDLLQFQTLRQIRIAADEDLVPRLRGEAQ